MVIYKCKLCGTRYLHSKWLGIYQLTPDLESLYPTGARARVQPIEGCPLDIVLTQE